MLLRWKERNYGPEIGGRNLDRLILNDSISCVKNNPIVLQKCDKNKNRPAIIPIRRPFSFYPE